MASDNRLSFGINTCFDLYEKLKYESNNLENDWNVYNSFNFIVTAWHLYHDWINNDKEYRPILATKKKVATPPNMMLVVNALRDITNSSKHFHLDQSSMEKKVVKETHSPIIGDAASYFLHGPMIYVKLENSSFSMWDLRHIVLLYFEWIFNDSIPASEFPNEINEHLQRCVINQ